MSTENKVNVPIQSTFDPSGTEQAAAGFRKTGEAAHGAKENLKELGYNADDLGKKFAGMLTEMVALAEVMSQFKEGVKEMMTVGAAWKSVEMATTRTGENFGKVKEEMEGLATDLRKIGGVADEVAVPAMARMYRASGDVENTLKLTRLAYALSITQQKDFGESMDAVFKAATGTKGALREFGITLDADTEATMKASEMLKLLSERAQGAVVDQRSLGTQLKKLAAEWDEIRGAVVAPIIHWLMMMVDGWKAAGASVEEYIRDVISGVTHGISVVEAMAKAVYGLVSRNPAIVAAAVKDASKQFEQFKVDVEANQQESAKKWQYFWERAADKVKFDVGEVPNAFKEAGGKVLEDTVRFYNAQEKAYFAHKQKMAKEEEREALEAMKHEKARVLDENQFKWEMTQKAEEMKRQALLATAKLEAQLSQSEAQFTADTLNAGVSAAAEAFGFQKELSIAQAVINTAEGITKALAMNGWVGIALAAVIAAAGAAQIAKISSSEAPSSVSFSGFKAGGGAGFDDPNNDQAARLGGRKWAADMIGEFTGGVSQGWREGMTGGGTSNTYDNRRTFNVHLHGTGLLDPTNVQQLKTLQRNLDMVGAQIDNQRTIARSKA